MEFSYQYVLTKPPGVPASLTMATPVIWTNPAELTDAELAILDAFMLGLGYERI